MALRSQVFLKVYTLVCSSYEGIVTLACYSIPLIGLCHCLLKNFCNVYRSKVLLYLSDTQYVTQN